MNRTTMDMKLERRKLAARRRRIIFNNDGNDCWFPKPVEPRTAENFLAQRTAPLVGSQVDAIAYCDGVVNRYSHQSAETELNKGGNNNEDNWAHPGNEILCLWLDPTTGALCRHWRVPKVDPAQSNWLASVEMGDGTTPPHSPVILFTDGNRGQGLVNTATTRVRLICLE